MAVSVFDLFKIGIGPSSSHTVGPMRAARLFAARLAHEGRLEAAVRVQAQLYGSLGATGKGHGSDKAVLLGLLGHEPDTVDVEAIPALLAAVRGSGRLALLGRHEIDFAEKSDLRFHRRESLRASAIMAERALSNPNVVPVWDSVVSEYLTDEAGEVRAVKLTNTKTGAESELEVKCVFVAIGHTPNTAAFKGKLDFNQVLELGRAGLGQDAEGYRAAYLQLVQQAMKLKN